MRNMRNKGMLAIAVGFFVFWLAVLYAGADHPPPPGFVLLVLLVAVAAVLVYVRTPTYVAWAATRRAGRLWRVLGEGCAVGALFGVAPLLLPGGGEPSVTPGWEAYLVWFLVLGGVGAVNAVLVYACGVLLASIRKHHP